MWVAAGLLALALVVAAAAFWQKEARADEERQLARLAAITSELGLAPLQAPPAQDAALAALGEGLFFETELSGNRDVSCATCHHPSLGLGDGLPLSIGPGGSGMGPERIAGPDRPPVGRNAIALFNSGAAERRSFFWDGRVEATEGGFVTPAGAQLPQGLDSLLATQALFPVTLRDEMRGGWYDVAGYTVQPGTAPDDGIYQGAPLGWHDVDVHGNPNELAAIANGAEQLPEIWSALMARLLAQERYRTLFAEAYPAVGVEALTFAHAANALAAYQTAAFAAVDTPWDRFLAGEVEALSPDAVAGGVLFFGEAGCGGCHSGALLSDGQYHNIGAPQLGPGADEDAPLDYGRWHVTGVEADRFAFRTPPLRNVALTGPWLHNGAYASLEEVVRHHLAPKRALRAYDGAHLPEELRATLQNAPVTLEAILATLDPLVQEERRLSAREIGEVVAFLEGLGGNGIGE